MEQLAGKKKKKPLKLLLKRPDGLDALELLASLFPALIARLGGLLTFLLSMLVRIPVFIIVVVVPIVFFL